MQTLVRVALGLALGGAFGSLHAASVDGAQCAANRSASPFTLSAGPDVNWGAYPQAFPEPAVGGPSAAEILAQQADLFASLSHEKAAPGAAGIRITLTDQDRVDIGEAKIAGVEPVAREKRQRIGVAKPVGLEVDFAAAGKRLASGGIFADGSIRPDGNGFTWTIEVSSPGASALRVGFDAVDLPAGAELYVFNARGEAWGPYTGRGPGGRGEFASHAVSGDTAFVHFRWRGGDAKAARNLGFRIADVGHMASHWETAKHMRRDQDAKAFCGFNASCVENAECPVNTWGSSSSYQNGVAHILFQSGRYYYICSGGLLADTVSGTQIPYFLTANHCFSRDREANTLEAYFQFTTPCGGACGDPSANLRTLGSTILSSNKTSDYTLVQLAQNPPAGSVFLGWSATPVANTNGVKLYRISHPSGAPQAYSQHDVDTSKGTCRSWPRGNWIYSRDIVGATEGGSSGSPVANANGQVVGQLSGGCGTNISDDCDPVSNATVDGALAAYFAKVKPWLDP